ncbi:MAG: hypothetical protein LC662_02030, partial [Rhodothermaceae bacterium]|nr:hypothetical protein [Rhodothermaceae bacterium]
FDLVGKNRYVGTSLRLMNRYIKWISFRTVARLFDIRFMRRSDPAIFDLVGKIATNGQTFSRAFIEILLLTTVKRMADKQVLSDF